MPFATANGIELYHEVSGEGGEIRPFDLEESTILELQNLMETEQLSAREITQRYLDRIAEVTGATSFVDTSKTPEMA